MIYISTHFHVCNKWNLLFKVVCTLIGVFGHLIHILDFTSFVPQKLFQELMLISRQLYEAITAFNAITTPTIILNPDNIHETIMANKAANMLFHRINNTRQRLNSTQILYSNLLAKSSIIQNNFDEDTCENFSLAQLFSDPASIMKIDTTIKQLIESENSEEVITIKSLVMDCQFFKPTENQIDTSD